MQVPIPSKADIRISDLDVGSQESTEFIDEYVPNPIQSLFVSMSMA